MLNETKLKAINLLVENNYTKVQIAEMLGISRTTLYKYLDDEEFVAHMNKCLQRIQDFGENRLKSNLDKCIENIVVLATKGESEKVRLDANQYIIDRTLGKTTAKIDITAETKEENTLEEINKAFDNVELEEPEDMKD